MANQDELSRSALNHALLTTWSWDKYLAEIRKNPNYNYKATEWYKAGADLEAAKHASPPKPPASTLADAQARIFLAGSPEEAMQAPAFMVPVLSADFGNYRSDEQPRTDEEVYAFLHQVVAQFRTHFAFIETWADSRNPTNYSAAVDVSNALGLDGAWGQCETRGEFDNAENEGARRMVGQLADLTSEQKKLIGGNGIHLAFELYRNKMPWQTPDYEDCADGVGGNCIGVYASSTEGAVYTPVSDYRSLGYYEPGRDSVYGVGLLPEDWAALA